MYKCNTIMVIIFLHRVRPRDVIIIRNVQHRRIIINANMCTEYYDLIRNT